MHVHVGRVGRVLEPIYMCIWAVWAVRIGLGSGQERPRTAESGQEPAKRGQ